MSEDSFLSRWSRRKRGVEVAEPEPKPEPRAPVAAPAPEPVAEAAPEPEFDPATLPDIETLTAESDFAQFLQKGVPEALKRLAMRRAWSLDPVIRDFVGPADYAWDFNAPDGVPGFALTLGGDAKRLLAHAIGKLEEFDAEAAKARGEEITKPEHMPEEAPEPPEMPPEMTEPVRLSPPEAEPEPPEPPAFSPEPAEPRPVPVRRRHGGALPE